MVDLKLAFDEGIVLQTTEVERIRGNKDITLDEIYLTNKNIICVYEKSNGLFKKADQITETLPISSIKLVNGKAQILKVDNDDYGLGLQILFNDGHRELFVFYDDKNDNLLDQWYTSLICIVSGEEIPQKSTAPKIKKVKESSAGAVLFAGVKEAFDLVKQSVADVIEQRDVSEEIDELADEESTPVPVVPQAIEEKIAAFCSNCGTKLNDGAKFCHGCGSAVGVPNTPLPIVQSTVATAPVVDVPKAVSSAATISVEVPPVETPSVEPPPVEQQKRTFGERRQEYIGTVYKCPHCGAVITQTTVVCPDCGNKITGRAAVSSVQDFKEQLMEIEKSRIGGLGGAILSASIMVDPADKKKLALIQNFPIPNSIDDILEFMMLAFANIDVGLSKNTALNKWNKVASSMESSSSIKRSISNAWVSKMQQAYQKAELLFPNDPAFSGIQRVYSEKMKELKIKV